MSVNPGAALDTRSLEPAQTGSTDVAARLLAAAGLAGAAIVTVLIGVLHFLPDTSGISPVSRTISEYALTDVGWMFNLGVLSLAAGSTAILAAIVRAALARPGAVGIWFGACWSAALTVIVLFPKHNWAVGPSVNGQIHRTASIVAFLALPVAVLLLTRRRAVPRRDHPAAARVARWLAVASVVWFVPILGALALSPVLRTPWWQAIPLGLVERGLVTCEVCAVIALGVWVLTVTRRTPSPPPASRALPEPAA
jgi:hypothetical protein